MKSSSKAWLLRLSLGGVLIGALNVFFINASSVSSDVLMSKGLLPLTEEEKGKLSKNKIKEIKANKLAVSRLNKERAKKGLPAIDNKEAVDSEGVVEIVSGANGAVTDSTTTNTSMGATPAQVDNSLLAAFPPIGSQGSLPSCVAWAITYYAQSHQACLALGCDNKNLRQKLFSPKWTYNFINGGAAQGTYFSDAFAVIANHGAPLNSEFPYDSNYRQWSLNSNHWKSAIQNRMSNYSYSSINTDAGMANAKQLLANGNVLVIGTYITSWVYGTVGVDPSQVNPFAGQQAVKYQAGIEGGHAMTLVGYDDSIFIDVNGNGLVDLGEKGAFKVANSWGAGWRNAGFIWASYDSFRATTAISGFAPAGRTQITQGGSSYLITYLNRAPKALVKVKVSHLSRNQMGLQLGSSSKTVLNPQLSFGLPAINYKGGAFAFDGSLAEVEATLYLDASDVITSSVDQHLYYLTSYDNVAGNSLSLRHFEIVDPISDATIYIASGLPAQVDASNLRSIAGDYTPDLTAPSIPSGLATSLVSVKRGKRVTTAVKLTWSASSDNVGVVKYIVYRNGVKLAESTTTTYSDSATSTGQSYSYQVSAVDMAGNVSGLSSAALVQR